MRVCDIIKPNEKCFLHHPIVGNVEWRGHPIDGWMLVFAEGPEKGDALFADDSVLLSDCWEKVDENCISS
jgi:hypothetical protein